MKRFRELHVELKKVFNVRATYLYGHSQGSFFSHLYAGAYPKDVQGLVGHASGIWASTKMGKKGHHQAVVLMHGTADGTVYYGQGVSGLTVYEKAKYPTVRLRSLEGWNHWPAEHNGPVRHTSQQLAWVEGMSTEDPKRMAACLEILAKVKNTDQHDFGGMYTLAAHLAQHPNAPSGLKSRARKAMKSVSYTHLTLPTSG